MSLTINDFAHRLRTAAVTLPGGATAIATELTYAEDVAIEEAFPRPLAPLVRDASKGTNSTKIPNTADPDYQRQHSSWFDRNEIMRLAVAIAYQPQGRQGWDRRAPIPDRRAWLDAAVDELTGSTSPAVLDAMRADIAKLSGTTAQEAAGLGNSGAGSSPATDG